MSTLVCHNLKAASNATCALLNGRGGIVRCNFHLDVEKLRMLIRPAPPPFGTNNDGELQIAEGQDKPYSADGRFSILDGDSVRTADREDIRDMLMASSIAPTRWERQFSDAIALDGFDPAELNMFAAGLHKESGCDFESELERIGLMRRGRFTNAADVLFCRDVAARQPQVRATAVAYGQKEDSSYAGHTRIEGFLIDVFNQLWEFFLQHACVSQTFDNENPRREAVYRFPPKAVKEGLVNALAHRDYESYAGGVKLEVGRDRIVITNAGGLFGGLKVEQLEQGHVFAFRNPDISNYLTIRGYMEMVGRGVLVIREECKAAGLPPPKWECTDTQVRLTIFGKQGTLPKIAEKGKRPPTVSWWPKSWPESWPESWPKSWPKSNENKILSLLYSRAMSKKELAAKMKIAVDSNSLKRAIKSLSDDKKLIEPTIKDKPTSRLQKYRLTPKGVELLTRVETYSQVRKFKHTVRRVRRAEPPKGAGKAIGPRSKVGG